MAALGAIGRETPSSQPRLIRIPFWSDAPLTVPVTGTITITVKDGATNVEGARVILYYRQNLIEVARGKTDGSGVCVFIGLNTADTSAYMAVVHEPDNGLTPTFHAMIQDYLTAV